MRGDSLRFVHCKHRRLGARQVHLLISPLGCYTFLFAMAIYMNPSGPDRWSRVKRPLFILSVLMYMFCSIHFALQFAHFYTALVCAMPHSRATRPLNTLQNTGGVVGFSTVTNVGLAIGLDMTFADFMGELIFIYRCWLLWSKNYWLFILPILASLSGIGELVLIMMAATPRSPITFGHSVSCLC